GSAQRETPPREWVGLRVGQFPQPMGVAFSPISFLAQSSSKVAEQAQARGLAFLRMKLNAVDVLLSNHRCVVGAILCLGDYRAAVGRFAKKRVNKIKEGTVVDAFQE